MALAQQFFQHLHGTADTQHRVPQFLPFLVKENQLFLSVLKLLSELSQSLLHHHWLLTN
jgi:hypothetical protein